VRPGEEQAATFICTLALVARVLEAWLKSSRARAQRVPAELYQSLQVLALRPRPELSALRLLMLVMLVSAESLVSRVARRAQARVAPSLFALDLPRQALVVVYLSSWAAELQLLEAVL
jgi:hypothetical protein